MEEEKKGFVVKFSKISENQVNSKYYPFQRVPIQLKIDIPNALLKKKKKRKNKYP